MEMDLAIIAQNIVNGIADFVAATSFGQFVIKKFDSVLWTIEQPAKYCVDGDTKTNTRELPWLIFWVILVYLQIHRIGISMILVKFDNNAIEPKDIVKKLQIWRRALRSIRFRGLRKIRENRSGNKNSNGVISKGSSPPRTSSNKKRNHKEMLDYDLLDDLLNRTFSDEETDTSFVISKIDEVSTNTSSNDSMNLKSPNKSKHHVSRSLQDTLPIESTSENEKVEANASAKSTEITFESTVADTDEMESAFMLSGEGSTSSLNEQSQSILDSNGKLSIGSTTETDNTNGSVKSSNISGNGSASSEQKSEKVGHGQESNQPSDTSDALMAKLLQKGGKPNHRMYGRYQQGNKKNPKGHIDGNLSSIPKRNKSQKPSSQETLHLQQPMKGDKNQEFHHSEKGN